jgi:hypothetical protein
MFFELIIFVAIVGLIVWGCSLLPLPSPFQQVILVIGVIAILLACLQAFFGIGHAIPLNAFSFK